MIWSSRSGLSYKKNNFRTSLSRECWCSDDANSGEVLQQCQVYFLHRPHLRCLGLSGGEAVYLDVDFV